MEAAQSLIFLVFLVIIFYFMLIRPQKRRVEQHRQLIQSVDVGDEVVTIGGLHGTVAQLGEDHVHLEVAPGTTLKFLKSAIARRVDEDAGGSDPEDVGEEEEA